MSRGLQHRLHTRLHLAAQLLDLPLTGEHLERLAVELTPAVQALLAEQCAELAASAPVAYAIASPGTDGEPEVQVTEYAGCTARISVDVDEDAPAALLAAELRRQPEVLATSVPTATYLALSVRPRSVAAWRWWLEKLNVAADVVTVHDDTACAVGVVGDVAVELSGQGVPSLVIDHRAARLAGLLHGGTS